MLEFPSFVKGLMVQETEEIVWPDSILEFLKSSWKVIGPNTYRI